MVILCSCKKVPTHYFRANLHFSRTNHLGHVTELKLELELEAMQKQWVMTSDWSDSRNYLPIPYQLFPICWLACLVLSLIFVCLFSKWSVQKWIKRRKVTERKRQGRRRKWRDGASLLLLRSVSCPHLQVAIKSSRECADDRRRRHTISEEEGF